MNVNSLKPWIDVVASLAGLIVGLIAALWAYTKFVVERGLLPPTQFWTECRAFGNRGGQTLLEIAVHLKNVGSSTLIATNIRADILYLTGQTLELSAATNPERAARFGRAVFNGSVKRDLLKIAHVDAVPVPRGAKVKEHPSQQKSQSASPNPPRDAFYVMPYDTFVQAKVDQSFTFVTAVPSATSHVLVWSSFEYAQSPKPLQKVILWVSRQLGLIQFTLEHATQPHTTERVFELPRGSPVGTADLEVSASSSVDRDERTV